MQVRTHLNVVFCVFVVVCAWGKHRWLLLASFDARGPFSRAVVVAAGVVVNFALAWACIFGSVTTGGIVQPHYEPGLLVSQVRC